MSEKSIIAEISEKKKMEKF